MATTYQEYTGNASTTTFSYPFPVLKTEDIKVALNGVTQTTGYTATTSPAQVVFSSAPASGVVVRVYRDTDVDAAKGVFAAGSSIRAVDLNNNQDQVLYALQEKQNQKGIFESISLDDDVKIKLGNGDDFTIEWDSSAEDALLTVAGDYTVNTTGAYRFKVGGSQKLFINNGEFISYQTFKPDDDDSIDLGTSSAQWRNLYVDGTGYIDTISADTATINGNLVVTGTISDSGGNLTLSDDVDISGDLSLVDNKQIKLGNSDDFSIEYSTTSNAAELNSNLTIFKNKAGNSTYLVVDNFVVQPYKDIVPNADDSLDLGASNYQWRNLYVDGTGYIDTVNADDITGSAIVTSGTSTSDTKVYSAKRAGEIFYEKGTLDDITSGDTWVADDNKLATTGAIDARIVDLVDDVGGFVPISNETSFPETNPDVNNGYGTLVSVPLANDVTSNSSGVINIPNGTVNTNTIVSILAAAANTTYKQGFGIIVETTDIDAYTYKFHRYVPKATEVTAVAGNIANVNTVAGNDSNITTVAGISGNVTTVAGVSANVTTVAGISSNVTTVAGISSNVTTVAGDTTAINNITTNLTAVQNAATNATNAASSATAAASSATAAAGSATTASGHASTAETHKNTASTQATNSASSATASAASATSAASSASTATTQASTATTQASNASTSAANALAYRNTAQQHRDSASAILTQVESSPYNLADNVSSHTAWGDITDTGANAVFTNETSNTLLTMAEGSSSYNYGSIT